MISRGTGSRVTAWTRLLGAAALLTVGLDHLEQFSTEHYSAIPTIGTLFVLNFASATLVAGGLLVPWRRLGDRTGRLAPGLLAVIGIAIAGGSLAGLLVSESTGLFGFMEVGYRGAIVLAIALDVATILLLGGHLAARAARRSVARDSARAVSA